MSEDQDDAFMSAWAASFTETRNPLYAMRGLLHALGKGDRPPAWVEGEMARISLAVLQLNQEYLDKRNKPRAAERVWKKLPSEIGLLRQGWNAFASGDEANDAAWTALDFRYAQRYENKEIYRAEMVAKWNGISVSAARRRLAKARKLKLSQD